MQSDSSKISYYLQYDYSPILTSKYKPFNEQESNPNNEFIDFSAEKNMQTPEFKTTQATNSLLTFKQTNNSQMFPFEQIKETSLTVGNDQEKSVAFSSKIFKPIPLIKKTTFCKKLTYRKSLSPLSSIVINQVIINGQQLKNFPFIHCDNDLIEVNLSKRLQGKHKYFSVTPINSKYHQPRNYYFPADKLKKIKLTPSQLSLNNITGYLPNETDPSKIIIKFYKDIRKVLLLHQNYLTMKRKKIYKEKASLELEKLISNCNSFTDYIKKVYVSFGNNFIVQKTMDDPVFKPVTKNRKRPLEFKCYYCRKKFSNGQALGGHISQSHPKQSSKYQKKLEIRNNRSEQRIAINESRKTLLLKYHYDYDTLIKDKANKRTIANILKMHKGEYKKLILSKKKERNTQPK